MIKSLSIVVTYNPDLTRLIVLVSDLIKQGVGVVVVDNSLEFNFEDSVFDSVRIIKNYNKDGIAGAQNIGIKYARESSVDFVCFFDQDSIVPESFAKCLINNRDPSVLSVYSPLVLDEASGSEYPAFRISKIGLPVKIYSEGSFKEYKVDLVISSGTVVSLKVFDLVGLFRNDLFIDLVDFEWCFRCVKFKVPIILVPSVRMKHSIGVGKGFITGSKHNSFRHYYKQRNSLYLLSYKHVPKMYSFKIIMLSFVNSFVMIFTQRESKYYFMSTVKGVYDGIKYLFLKR